MAYRILCDENVDPHTVQYLEREGHEAIHVGEALALGVDDHEVAAYAHENEMVILTNDTDFLDPSLYPDQTVLFYTNNRIPAYELAALVTELTEYYPSQDDLPHELYISDENG
jgi:predicted nuclease of predicted toxin-antitoxin system